MSVRVASILAVRLVSLTTRGSAAGTVVCLLRSVYVYMAGLKV